MVEDRVKSGDVDAKAKAGRCYTVALDLGESHVVAIAGYRDEVSGALKIGATAKRPTQGLRVGRIENIAHINGALSAVIADLENKLDIEIEQAYGGISGEFLRCERHTETILIEEPSNGVATTDVVALHNLMRNVLSPESDKILEATPEKYMVDGRGELKNPVGTFGRTLSATFNFTLCEKDALKRLNLAFMQAGITMKSCFSNAIVAAEAVLSTDEMEAGVALVDLGEGVTNIAIYYRGTLRYMVSIPIGGSAINSDLKSLMIQERNIEEIKRKYGCAVATLANKGSISVAGRTPRENKNIPLYNIAVAIEERVSDIIIFIQREIRDAGFEGRLPYGLVLTGGGANLKHIDDLFRRNTQLDVRVATPEESIDVKSLDEVATPGCATVIGLLRRGIALDIKSGKYCTPAVALVEEEQQPAEEQPAEESTEQPAESRPEEETPEPQYPRQEEFTQTELDLDDIEEEEEEEPAPKRRGGFRGALEGLKNSLNNLFTSSDSDDPNL